MDDFFNNIENSIPEIIDIQINSFYSFLSLKKKHFFDILKKKVILYNIYIRFLTICHDNDQINQVQDFFKRFENSNNLQFLTNLKDKIDDYVIVIVDRKKVFFINIQSNNLVFRENTEEGYILDVFDHLWNLASKNEILDKRNIFQQDFVDIATHQLRNPILPILGFSKTLRSKISDPTLIGYIDIVIKNAEKLRDIANIILDISRIEANPTMLNYQTFDLRELLDISVEYFRQISNQEISGIKFTVNSDHNLFIKADKEFLKQAFDNILNNSYYFTKQNEGNEIIITVNTPVDDDCITVMIEDEGPGIPEEQVEKLFTRFYPYSSGAGLGLYIAKKIFEVHGGSITLENRYEYIGSKFVVCIPSAIDSLPFELDRVKINNKILVVDEPSENLNSIMDKMIKLGYSVDFNPDPLDVLESFNPYTYALVFLGVDINGLNGFDVYDDLKKRDKNIKGYFMSTKKILRDAMEILNFDLKYDQFLQKPLSFDDFCEIIKNEINQ